MPVPTMATRIHTHHEGRRARKTTYAMSPAVKMIVAIILLLVTFRMRFIKVLIAFTRRVSVSEIPPSLICRSNSFRTSRLLIIKAVVKVKIAIAIDNPPIIIDRQELNMSE